MPRPAFVVLSSGGAGVAAADITDAGATGVSLVQAATEAAARATLGRTIDPMTGAGWTSLTPASGATTTWSAGTKVTFDIPAAVTVFGAAGIEDSDFVPDSTTVDVCARLDFVTGDGESYTTFVFALGSSINDCIVWGNTGGGNNFVGRIVSGVWTEVGSASASGILSGDRTGGQLWLRISRSPAGVAFFYGVGSSGAVPTQWTIVRIITDTLAVGASFGRYVRLGIDTSSGVAGGFNVDVLAIRTSAAGAPL